LKTDQNHIKSVNIQLEKKQVQRFLLNYIL